jgi:putative ABC transport system permease protein
VFAVIALAVTLLVGAQAIARQVRAGDADRVVLRALGAGPAMVAADSLLGLLGAVTAGALLAVVVAVTFSPVAPIGPVRPVYPAPGVAFDWAVLGGGFLLLAGVFGAVAVILTARAAARRGRGRAGTASPPRGSAAGRLAVASGLPATAVAGFQFAFDSGAGQSRRAVPARSALSAAVLAVVIVMTTLTFGASLSALVSHPALYGWNWSYALASNQGPEAVPGQQVDANCAPSPASRRGPRSPTPPPTWTDWPFPCCSATRTRPSRRRSCPGARLPAGTRSCSAPPRWRRCTSTWAARCRSPSPGLACGSRTR